MLRLDMIGQDGLEMLDVFRKDPSVPGERVAVLDHIFRHWNEDGGEGLPVYIIRDGSGNAVGTVLRDPDDASVAHVTMPGFGHPFRRVRTVNVADPAARYQLATEVTDLDTGKTRRLMD